MLQMHHRVLLRRHRHSMVTGRHDCSAEASIHKAKLKSILILSLKFLFLYFKLQLKQFRQVEGIILLRKSYYPTFKLSRTLTLTTFQSVYKVKCGE